MRACVCPVSLLKLDSYNCTDGTDTIIIIIIIIIIITTTTTILTAMVLIVTITI